MLMREAEIHQQDASAFFANIVEALEAAQIDHVTGHGQAQFHQRQKTVAPGEQFGFVAVALHGDMDQPARTAALEQFRRGESPLLVASDVAARGLDIPDVSHVFNFDVPHHADDYVHRVGRTARAGRSGTAISIVAPQDRKAVAAIEKLTGLTIAWMSEPAAAPAPHRGHRDDPAKSASKAAANHRRAPRTAPPRIDPVRPARTARPAQPPAPATAERDQGGHDLNHLPAFLLRPVPARA